MVIETEVQIKKHIVIKISDDDVDGFLEEFTGLFTTDLDVKSPNHPANKFSTLHKIWLEVKQQI